MIFNLEDRGGFKGGITSTGAMQYASIGADWEAVFEESGTITFTEDPGNVDIFLLADGKSGANGRMVVQGGVFYYGGDGGAGGNYVIAKNIPLGTGSFTLTLGATATLVGGDVSLSTANGSSGKSGGQGGLAQGGRHNSGGTVVWDYGSVGREPGKGTDGIFAYNDGEDKTLIADYRGNKFAAGGGGGDAFISALGIYTTADQSGGDTDGGDGASMYKGTVVLSTAGGAKSGSGGGGGYYGWYGGAEDSRAASAGGSGVCFIRRHRED